MILSQTGESRVNGYLFVLERSLRTFLPRDTVADAVREIESHVRERVAAVDPNPDERTALEQILAELGPPLRVAQAYSAERTIEEAVTTGRLVPIARAIGHVAASTVTGFVAALGVLMAYVASFAFVAIAVLKPIFPDNVGLITVRGVPVAFGAQFPVAPGHEMHGGYWIIPIALAIGLAIFVGATRGARRFLARFRKQPSGAAEQFVG